MANTTETPSTFGKLNVHDFFHGLIMAIGTPLLLFIQEQIPNYNLPDWAELGLSVLITYLIKNVLTDNVKISQKVLSKAVRKADTDAQVQSIVEPIIEASADTPK